MTLIRIREPVEGLDNYHGYVCPHCHSHSYVEIQITTWIHLVGDGTDDSGCNNDKEWDDDSEANCAACGFGGKVLHFQQLKPCLIAALVEENLR